MPHCPRCGRRFPTDEKVTRHMSQPRSSCVNLDVSDLVSIVLPPNTLQPQNVLLEHDQGLGDIDVNVVGDDGNFSVQGDPDIQMAADNSGFMYRDELPNAAPTWGAGKTFMGRFDLDDFADQHKENLYYPFASKEDWEMAAFLLRSGMSMALIDDFLSLQFVGTSLFILEIHLFTSIDRLKTCHSHFGQQRT